MADPPARFVPHPPAIPTDVLGQAGGPIPVGIRVVGVEPTGGNDLLVTVAAETRPSRRAEVEHELRRKLNRKLLPFPQQVGDDGDAIDDGPER